METLRYNGGDTLSYAEYGDRNGEPVLIQHGLIASIEGYTLFDSLIKAGKRLICIARPGYGKSSPYAMENIGEWGKIAGYLVEELGLEQFDVLGMSSGAPFAYAIGYNFPEKVKNIYIYSGIPALYDSAVMAEWTYPKSELKNIEEYQKLAYDLFFSNLSDAELKEKYILDSMMNNCFGVAMDLKLRGRDWGFSLADVKQPVYMQHSSTDDVVIVKTTILTAQLIPD